MRCALLPFLALLACAPRQEPAASPAAPAAASPAPPAPASPAPPAQPFGGDPAALRLHMGERLTLLTQARDQLVRGDDTQARASLERLARLDVEPGLPPGWDVWLKGMSEQAGRGSASADAGTLAAAVAQAANQCGGCHQALARRVALPHPGPAPTAVSGSEPSGDPGVARHMEGHQWAVDRMWAGLVEPSDRAWAESLQVLTQPALDTLSLEVGAVESQAVAAATMKVHELAQDGLSDDNPDTRADLYGQVLSACASCHALQREGG